MKSRGSSAAPTPIFCDTRRLNLTAIDPAAATAWCLALLHPTKSWQFNIAAAILSAFYRTAAGC
jgi:hypothetical protein